MRTRTRRLAAIMFTDIVGYTALMADSEARGLRVRKRHRELLARLVTRYVGDIVDETGDETLSTFGNVLDAVNCALAVQTELEGDSELRVRIGIHCADVTPHLRGRGERGGTDPAPPHPGRASRDRGVSVR